MHPNSNSRVCGSRKRTSLARRCFAAVVPSIQVQHQGRRTGASVPHEQHRHQGHRVLPGGQPRAAVPHLLLGLKPGFLPSAFAARLEVVPFPVLLVAGLVVLSPNSRFLTGPLALFGMTTSLFWCGFYAALKRRSSRLCKGWWSCPFNVKSRINFKSVGQECPTHTGNTKRYRRGRAGG